MESITWTKMLLLIGVVVMLWIATHSMWWGFAAILALAYIDVTVNEAGPRLWLLFLDKLEKDEKFRNNVTSLLRHFMGTA